MHCQDHRTQHGMNQAIVRDQEAHHPLDREPLPLLLFTHPLLLKLLLLMKKDRTKLKGDTAAAETLQDCVKIVG